MRRVKDQNNRFEATGKWLLKLCLPVVLLCVATISQAQDIHFSQFSETPILRNPSMAGNFTGDYRIQGVYRDQWNNITNAYRTGSLNAEYKIRPGKGKDFMTAALQVLYDKSGSIGLTTTNLLPALDYHKSLSDEKTMYLSVGFMGGLVHKSVDMSKITTDNQYGGGGYDPSLPTGETFAIPNFTTWDASAGISFNSSFGKEEAHSFYLGAAYHHLNRPKNSFYRNPTIELEPKYVFSEGVKFTMNDQSYFTIQADQSIQGSFTELIGGAIYSYNLGDFTDQPDYTLHAGAYWRWKDALVPVVKIDMHSLSIGISYDVNISPLKTVSRGRGGFELSLSYIGFISRSVEPF